MNDDRPAWARRMTREREARGWSQADVITAMRMHAPKSPPDGVPKSLPDDASMLRQWKRWESGEHTPSEFYQPIIAAAFGTVTHAMFPESGRRDGNAEILAVSGMDTLELVSRMQASDLDNATIDALRITTDRLCSDYPFLPSDQLLTEGRNWLRRLIALRGQRLTLDSAPRDPRPGRMAESADRLRGVRQRQSAGSGDDAPGCVVTRHGH